MYGLQLGQTTLLLALVATQSILDGDCGVGRENCRGQSAERESRLRDNLGMALFVARIFGRRDHNARLKPRGWQRPKRRCTHY